MNLPRPTMPHSVVRLYHNKFVYVIGLYMCVVPCALVLKAETSIMRSTLGLGMRHVI